MGYVTKIWKTGNSLVITVPPNQLDYFGLVEGDKVEVHLKKKFEDDQEED